jgi:hypothetical protein
LEAGGYCIIKKIKTENIELYIKKTAVQRITIIFRKRVFLGGENKQGYKNKKIINNSDIS